MKRVLSLLLTVMIASLCGCQSNEGGIICELPVSETLGEGYNCMYVSGSQARAAIENMDDLVVVVTSHGSSDENYAMVCNKSLWTADVLSETEYAHWISKDEFNNKLSYDEESGYYYTDSPIDINVDYSPNIDVEDSIEEIWAPYKYKSNIIKSPAGESIGIVLEYALDGALDKSYRRK